MKKRLLHVLSVFMLFSLLLSACSGTQQQAQVRPPLRIAWALWPGWYPLVLADQKGFFTEHGIEVEIIYYNSQTEVNSAVASGVVDGGFMVLNDTLLDAVSENAKVVLLTDNSDGGDQIVSATDILNADDLRGKRIGTKRGSFGEFFVREMLEQKGISTSDLTFINVGPDEVTESIPTVIDIGHTWEPYTSEALAKGFKVIFTSADTPGLIVDTLAFRKPVIAERPEDIKAFIAAWFEALQYWQSNPEESNAIIAAATGQKVEDISTEGIKLFGLQENLNAFKPGSDTTSVYFTARKAMKFLIDSGFVTQPVDVNEALDASFLQ